MNDAAEAGSTAKTKADRPVVDKAIVTDEAKNLAKVPEDLSRPQISFWEAAYYWVISRR